MENHQSYYGSHIRFVVERHRLATIRRRRGRNGGKEKGRSRLSENPEVATGYFKTSWTGETITPDMATVTFSKKGEGVAWGGLYWQYFEDLDKITPAETPLETHQKNICSHQHRTR